MKIYCILLDATTLKQELIDFSKKHNFKLSCQFTSGIYTIPTMISMLYGQNPNKIIKNGISYFGPKYDSNNFFNFLKNNNLIKTLNEQNYEIFIDNFYKQLRIPIGWQYYENKDFKWSNLKTEKNIKYLNVIKPNIYKNIKLLTTKYNPAHIWSFENYQDDTETKKYYEQILNNIKFVQNQKGKDTFYILRNGDYHSLDRLYKTNVNNKMVEKVTKRVIELLEKIDFNEPDSLFYIFGDHGLGGNGLFDLENYYTWALIKDNTKNDNILQKPFISSCDFCNFILNKLSLNPINNIESKNIYSKFDKNRIYYIQDSRMYASPISCDSIATIKITKYKEYIPLEILQLTYVRGICDTIQKFYLFKYNLKEDKINKIDYLFDYNFDKTNLFEGSKEELLEYKNINEDIKELYESLIKNNPCIYENIDESVIQKEDLIKINSIREYIKINYKSPKQTTVSIDNKTVYRYNIRDKTEIINKYIPKLIKYNNILNKYIKLD